MYGVLPFGFAVFWFIEEPHKLRDEKCGAGYTLFHGQKLEITWISGLVSQDSWCISQVYEVRLGIPVRRECMMFEKNNDDRMIRQ